MDILRGKRLSASLLGSCLILACGSGELDVFDAEPNGLIDDFEDQNNRPVSNVGWWFYVNDGSSQQVLEFPTPSDPARGKGALHTSGGPFTGWGAEIGVDLTSSGSPRDASRFSALQFMMMVEPGSQSTMNAYVQAGGLNFSHSVTLDVLWQKYSIPFVSFVDAADPTLRLDPSRITFIQFYFQQVGVLDMWLDDVAFVNDP
jgi:hypothetical protein